MNPETRQCNMCSNSFTLESDDFSFYEKMKVPAPHVCPDCRFKMRALFRNEMSLYSGRKCAMCEKSIVTMYNPKSPYTVYCNECYRGDGWDSATYAMDYDIDRPFFDQLKELSIKVPKNSLFTTTGSGQMINSEYTSCSGGLKNCNFVFNATHTEDSAYCRGITYSTEVLDGYFGSKLDRCYEVVNTQQSSKVLYGHNVVGCVDCMFMLNCSGCTDCFGCVNIRNKSHCFFNEQLSKEEYDARLMEIKGSYSAYKQARAQFEVFKLQFPMRENNNLKVSGCIGDYLTECKNTKYSFEISKGEDSKWNFSSREVKDSYGTIGYGIKSELLLECTSTGYTSFGIGCWACELSQNIEYCLSCFSGNQNIIGCDSLKNSQYCILNKQYSKEDYEALKAHIVQELTELGVYGLMMPPALAPFAYNESIANDNMPMTKEEVLKAGFRWEDDIQMTKGKETLAPEEIPDHISGAADTITSEILRCTTCERNYKITEQELMFYRKMILPIPRQCFYCRHHDRIKRRGPYQFWHRTCAHCNKDIETNYSPESPEIVYCESCYQQEIL